MVASPEEMLDDLTDSVQELQRVKREGSQEQVEALKNLITDLSCELEDMGFCKEVRQVLRDESVSTPEGTI